MEPRVRLLGNRYKLLVPLASGGMGRVWRARDTLLERPVAVKVLRSEFTGDPTFRARFRAEAQHTAALAPPEHRLRLRLRRDRGGRRAPRLPRHGARRGRDAVGPAGAGGPAQPRARPSTSCGRRPPRWPPRTPPAWSTATSSRATCWCGTDGVVKITDFGIAWSASSVPADRHRAGRSARRTTCHPSRPRAARRRPASDVYALGAVAYECLAGRRAFEGENSVQVALKQIREEPAAAAPRRAGRDSPAGGTGDGQGPGGAATRRGGAACRGRRH